MFSPVSLKALLTSLLCGLSSLSLAALEMETIAEGLDTPWSMAELPDGGFLVTERPGSIKLVAPSGEMTNVIGVPDVFAMGQGGLFDVVIHPNFASNRTIFLSYASGTQNSNRTTVARAVLNGHTLSETKVIFEVNFEKRGVLHFGGRMAFMTDGTLLLTVGEGSHLREEAQNTENQLGTLLRMTENGEAPADNPFANAPYIFSYGHRNPQGLIVDPVTQSIWMTEHGPKGGDELNRIESGKNYGWPAITYGVDYSGAIISPFKEAPGMEQPATYWVPSIATSGLALYTSSAIPSLTGKLLVGGLKAMKVVAVDVSGDTAIVSEPFPELEARVRDVRALTDGSIAVIDESGGKVIRVRQGAE
ncbi:MAG: PQQ-dependent sugar dehydrogenase [Luminiphilus sp.]